MQKRNIDEREIYEDDDREEEEGAPLLKAENYNWRVRVGIFGDVYRSERADNGVFKWRYYEPDGPISMHPESETIVAPSSTEAPPLKIMPVKRNQPIEQVRVGLQYRLDFITDEYSEGQRIPNPVSGMVSGLMEFRVQNLRTSEIYNLVFGANFTPERLLAIMPRWDNSYTPIGLIKRAIDKKKYVGVVCRKN